MQKIITWILAETPVTIIFYSKLNCPFHLCTVFLLVLDPQLTSGGPRRVCKAQTYILNRFRCIYRIFFIELYALSWEVPLGILNCKNGGRLYMRNKKYEYLRDFRQWIYITCVLAIYCMIKLSKNDYISFGIFILRFWVEKNTMDNCWFNKFGVLFCI